MQLFLSGNIRRYRKALGLTQEQLAEAMNVTVGAVSKWETEQNTPDLPVIVQLAELFGVSVDTLLGYAVQSTGLQQTVDRLEKLRQQRQLDEGCRAAEKALLRYPNNFDVAWHSAVLYSLRATVRHSADDTRRAQELFRRCLVLKDQNSDPRRGEQAVRNKIIETDVALGEVDRAIDELKSQNAGGVHSGRVGYLLAAFTGRHEEALPWLSEGLIRGISDLMQVCIGFVNCFYASGRFQEGIALAGWMSDLLEGLKLPGTVTYLDKMQVMLYACCTQLAAGQQDRTAAKNYLRQAQALARRFDAAPDFELQNLRFCHFEAAARPSAFDDFGETAMQGLRSSLLGSGETGSAPDPRLAALWEELEQEETSAGKNETARGRAAVSREEAPCANLPVFEAPGCGKGGAL